MSEGIAEKVHARDPRSASRVAPSGACPFVFTNRSFPLAGESFIRPQSEGLLRDSICASTRAPYNLGARYQDRLSCTIAGLRETGSSYGLRMTDQSSRK